ncbi:HAD family hydrolase [Listeria fleischmannii]|uniref:HAD family hydrolase n=1 Tax=Listeria fleischmannii TaxID=1069827 RepID=UPI000E05DEAF|nr:HAD hydrolase family protein [Listeria fleischmannii]STY35633.1 sugar phosphate phosphatase [Listeria fleischmannii subsp. coloradonensis]
MDKQIIFIDVDGTLCNDYGQVPESAGIAIHKARQNGHKVYLCTGRSKAELTDDIKKIEFDGFIGAGGAILKNRASFFCIKNSTWQTFQASFTFLKKKASATIWNQMTVYLQVILVYLKFVNKF